MEQKRNTKQKQLILSILKNSQKPMSINEIYQAANEFVPNIAKSTIYRNIDALIKQDLVDKYYLSDSELFYKIKNDTHEHKHYVICDQCKRMFDLPVCPIHDIQTNMLKEGFTITDHYIQISGICKECQCKKSPEHNTQNSET